MSKNRMIGPAIAVLITVAFIVWMWSGTQAEEPTKPAAKAEAKSLIAKVQFVESQARAVQQTLNINGTTQAARHLTVRSEAAGRLIAVRKKQGDSINKGDIIVQIDLDNIPDQIRQAKALQEQTRLEYEGAQKLFNKGLINEASLAANLTSYEQAKANLAALNLQQQDHTIRAPISGQVEDSDLEVGTLISTGDAIATIYDYSQLKFTGAVAEKDITELQLGQPATVRFTHGETAQATVTFISSVANPATRSFTVELTIPEVNTPVSGVTSEATIELSEVQGHYVTPALLTINDDGVMGMKVLDEENHVQFRRIEILRSDTDGVWISGLAPDEKIITVGQGFVNINDEVAPTEKPFDESVAVGL